MNMTHLCTEMFHVEHPLENVFAECSTWNTSVFFVPKSLTKPEICSTWNIYRPGLQRLCLLRLNIILFPLTVA
jgi:hypothetical protein